MKDSIEEEIVWRRICILAWLGYSVEKIQGYLEQEYGIPLTEEMKELIKSVKKGEE